MNLTEVRQRAVGERQAMSGASAEPERFQLENVAIFIPTMNRTEFVIRQVRYYAATCSGLGVYIGDSSTSENAEILRHELESIEGPINIHYHYLPGWNDRQAERFLLEQATEKFITFSGDDDLHFPSTLVRAAAFLESNPEYSYARGEAFGFKIRDDQTFGPIEGTFSYTQIENEQATAAGRLEKFSERYNVTLFSLQHTEDLRDSFLQLPDSATFVAITEIVPCTLTAVRGKGKVLAGYPGFLRQVREVKNAVTGMRDLIFDPAWHENASCYVQCVARMVEKVDGLDEGSGQALARVAWGNYVQTALGKKTAAGSEGPDRPPEAPTFFQRALHAIKVLYMLVHRMWRRLVPIKTVENLPEVEQAYRFLRTGEL